MRRTLLRTAAMLLWALWIAGLAEKASAQARPDGPGPSIRDGRHDFDFEIGVCKTHLKRRAHPLSGSDTWSEYDGTTTVRKVWNGLSNLVGLEVDGAQGHIEALSLRLYNPGSHQWSLNFANGADGTGLPPTHVYPANEDMRSR
jgi:hypothetical protein